MKLWIDDIRNAPDDSWLVARTVTEAIRAISRFDFDEISLDHDISHQVVMGELSRPYPCPETYEAVVHFIAEKYWTQMGEVLRPLAGPKITLHTSNPIGAEKMAAILKDAGIKAELKLTGLAANRLEMEI